MSVLKVEKLTKKFKDFTAVDNISFELPERRVLGFLGPNGAGKTTTIRMIAGLSEPTSGSIEIENNKVVFGNSKTNNLIGYLPEQPSFYSWMTGEEYLTFIAKLFKFNRVEIKEKVQKLLSVVNLTSAKNKKVSTYSNGMKQRLGIAQALINDPELLILDEPVSALDPFGRKEVLDIILKLKADKSVLFSTHILSDVDRVCDDVVILNHGKMIAYSPLVDLKKKYAKPILMVEFDSSPEEIIGDLKKENWVKGVEIENNHLKIRLESEKVVEDNVPLKYFAKCSLGILNYGLKQPETEELFINLLEEK